MPIPISLPDYDRGLFLIHWKARGFDEMRRLGLISHKAEFELVEGMPRTSWKTHSSPHADVFDADPGA